MANIIFKYPLDLLGTSPDNKVINEEHTIGTTRARLFAADYGPFFGNSVVILDGVTGRELIPVVDYRLLHPYREARDRTGQAVYAAVQITNPDVSTRILFTAQQVGGEFSFSSYALKQAVTEIAADERPLYYGDLIGIPSTFVPAPHLHSAYDLYGMKYLVEANYDIAAAIREGDAASRQLLLNQIRQKFEVVDALIDGWKSDATPKINEVITLPGVSTEENPREGVPAGTPGSKTYDLVTILGANHLLYNKLGSVLNVKVRDIDETSPTFNMYINSQAVLTVGIDTAGKITLVNYFTRELEFHVLVTVPRNVT